MGSDMSLHRSTVETTDWRPLVRARARSLSLALLMLLSSFVGMQFAAYEAAAGTDQDGDGLTCGTEFLLGTQCQDWDSDNDGLPDGWEWQYGLDPTDGSSLTNNGASGDPDGDGMSNLQEYSYLEPNNWDNTNTANLLDNGVWWNGTVPVRNWNEENAMQVTQPGCGDPGSDGNGSNVILCDEDPPGDICNDGLDNDKDGLVDTADPDRDGDEVCGSNDDDGDGYYDEDPDGWDTDGDGMPDGWEASNGLNATSSSGADGMSGDPDNDGLINIMEYINPAWTTSSGGNYYFQPGNPNVEGATENVNPCNPVLGLGPGGCATITASVDSDFDTDPFNNDTDGDGLEDGYEALVILTDPTASDTDSDGILDGIEANVSTYGDPAQHSDPRDNNTDGDQFDDGDEDVNGNGQVDSNETDPTRREDSGDYDNDGIDNWLENLSCTLWDVFDTDSGGVGDGDESNLSHGTDPCMSLVDFSTTVVSYNGGTNRLTVNNSSGIDPDPVDWRPGSPPGTLYYNDSTGSLTSFTYSSVTNNVIDGVSVDPATAGVAPITVIAKNGSWCNFEAMQPPPTITTTHRHCDDDYSDQDGDGLANWEETMAVYGWFSLYTDADSDGDGVDDLTEILDFTDPMEPCDNRLDSDGDQINDYFENTTGCDLKYVPGMGAGNGSTDAYVTDYLDVDTDNGGVMDGQEYLDGTNPENDPLDDMNPADTDGDGIPDNIENQTGTDWRDPDTDGGGMTDYEECPPQYWQDCNLSPQNPWDPTDDIIQNDVAFWANNTSSTGIGVLPDLSHYWRVRTYESYTGAAYGMNASSLIETQITPAWVESHWIADNTFWNSSEEYWITYMQPIPPGSRVPQPASAYSWMSWVDSMASLNQSNVSHDLRVSTADVMDLTVSQPEIWFSDTEYQQSIPYAGPGNYGTDLPDYFTNLTKPESYVYNLTQNVISGKVSAWDKVTAIRDYLNNEDGNTSVEFKLNFDGSGVPMVEDISRFILEDTKEGSCQEYDTVFTTMARLAGIPARKATGFHSGTWTGSGFMVMGRDTGTWSEVHLQQNSAGNNLDMGWIPIESCPPAEQVEVVNESSWPGTIERDMSSGDIYMNGTLQFSDNQTAAADALVRAYLVQANDTTPFNPTALNGNSLVGANLTDSNGNFSIKGFPFDITHPGYGRIVVETQQGGYVPYSTHDFVWTVNITDDTNLTQDSPVPVGIPYVGAGATTDITGTMNWNSSLGASLLDVSTKTNYSVSLTYFSTVLSQNVTQTTQVGANGFFMFTVNLSDAEVNGPRNATLDFAGWHEGDLHLGPSPIYHARPTTYNFVFNVTPAPDLTASLAGPSTNDSLLEIGENIYINGTILSGGVSPAPMNGTLLLMLRRNGSTGPYSDITSWILNVSNVNQTTGNFSIVWNFSASDVPIGPSYCDVILRFTPEVPGATDDANLPTGYGIQSTVDISIPIVATLRDESVIIPISFMDHTTGTDIPFNGTWVTTFDGVVINTTIDPVNPWLDIEFIPGANLVAGDYLFNVTYTPTSPWYKAAANEGLQRIQADIAMTINLSQDWTHLGGQNVISGTITDAVLASIVLDNQTNIQFNLEIPGTGPPGPNGEPPLPIVIPIGNGSNIPSNGTYSINVTMPDYLPSGAYNLTLNTDWDTSSTEPGPYYVQTGPLYRLIGIESELVLTSNRSVVVVEAGNPLELNITVQDVADMSAVVAGIVHFTWDWDGSMNMSIGMATSNADGSAIFNWPVPLSMAPGYYDLRVSMPDDLLSGLEIGNRTWTGNETFVNVTVQVPSSVNIISMPANVTAQQSFTLEGNISDGNDPLRPMIGSVDIQVFFFNDTSEVLVTSFTTQANGSFNLSVPTDPNGDGITSGNKTLVISVINGSSPFYLNGSGQQGILVIGVTVFETPTPSGPIIVTRGDSVEFGADLKEESDQWRLLANVSVSAMFHDTWMTVENTTDANGTALFNWTVPNTHPLGQITVTLFYNGSWTLHPASLSINNVNVRSLTFLVVDPITANPMAGESFNVSGTLLSDNGSGIIFRDGSGMLPQLSFTIDGFSDTFLVSNGIAQANGTWEAIFTLDTDFPRGNHNLIATYTSSSPTTYGSSSGNNSFDSRGFSVLQILAPLDLHPDDRTIRGENVTVQILLQDNTMTAISNATVTIAFPDLNISITAITDMNGNASVLLNVPAATAPGPLNLTAEYAGLAGSTGVAGDNDIARVIILAPTVLSITSVEGEFVSGEVIYVNGTLLDEFGMVLQEGGVPQGGIVHLEIDGAETLTMVESNATTGIFSIQYTLLGDIGPGAHLVGVYFQGGYMWVDPMGQGDSSNPEYYLNSTDQQWVNVSVPTHIVLITSGGDIDREELLVIDGMLLDLVNNPLSNETIEIWFNGYWLTNVTTTVDGTFSVYYPVPQDSDLGPQQMELRFMGSTFYLPSEANTTWNVYSPVNLDLVLPAEIAINDPIVFTGTARDNLPDGWIYNHSVELRFNGTLVGTVYTDSEGVWVLNWTIPSNIGLGSHPIEIYSPAQGWYRESSANGTIWVAHHSSILLSVEDDGHATRGEFWNVSGRLYDSDEPGLPGISGRNVDIMLDGVLVDTVTTDSEGRFQLLVPVSMVSARGGHTLSAHYAGESAWLATNDTISLTTWADISWQLVENSNIIIRSSSSHQIILEGRILEEGGSVNPVSDLDLTLYWNTSSLDITNKVVWLNDSSFRIELMAPQTMFPGDITLTLKSSKNNTHYFNYGEVNVTIFVVVAVDFEVGILDVPHMGQKVIVWVDAHARDTQLPVADIEVAAVLHNESYGYSRTLVGRTSVNGSFWFEFNSVPPTDPYGDKSVYGDLYVQINSSDEKVAADDRALLEQTLSVNVLPPEAIADSSLGWIYGGIAALVLSALVFAIWWRRRQLTAIEELADIFSYTAELLAAGDEVREAIFNCYEGLCAVLMKHRFLRRDFETVREFEMAIRKALPINEDALVALDSVFEEARYSRHEMAEEHKNQAQEALRQVLVEIESLQEVPVR